MSKEIGTTETTLRQRFASEKTHLIAHAEYDVVKSQPLANAYFNGDVLKYEGKVLSSAETESVKPLSKVAMYAVEKGGFSKIAEGQSDSVALDQKKINRMTMNIGNVANRQVGRE